MIQQKLVLSAVAVALSAGPAFAALSQSPSTMGGGNGIYLGGHSFGCSCGGHAVASVPSGPSPIEVALNWDQIAGNWKQFTGKARQRWGKLTDNDLEVAKGRREELVGLIQERYGISKEDADREVDVWLKSLEP
jgi:uncharacterized protein YjbJ (UPF0337 family)